MRIRIFWEDPLPTEMDLTPYEAEKLKKCQKDNTMEKFEGFIMDRARERTDFGISFVVEVGD